MIGEAIASRKQKSPDSRKALNAQEIDRRMHSGESRQQRLYPEPGEEADMN
jgi:hypothetical protein